VVDYDKACWRPRVAELAEALIYFASPRPGYLEHLVYPGTLRWRPFDFFLRHYARETRLGRSELEALPAYVRCIWFCVSLLRLLERDARPSAARAALAEVVVLGDWAMANRRRMVEVSLEAAGMD